MTDQPSRKPPVLRTPMVAPGAPEAPLDEADEALIQAVLEAQAAEDRAEAEAKAQAAQIDPQ